MTNKYERHYNEVIKESRSKDDLQEIEEFPLLDSGSSEVSDVHYSHESSSDIDLEDFVIEAKNNLQSNLASGVEFETPYVSEAYSDETIVKSHQPSYPIEEQIFISNYSSEIRLSKIISDLASNVRPLDCVYYVNQNVSENSRQEFQHNLQRCFDKVASHQSVTLDLYCLPTGQDLSGLIVLRYLRLYDEQELKHILTSMTNRGRMSALVVTPSEVISRDDLSNLFDCLTTSISNPMTVMKSALEKDFMIYALTIILLLLTLVQFI